MKKITVLSCFYIFVICLLFLYSYTQVDLSLTLSRVSIYQAVEKFFQHIGYFQRPFSTIVYIILLILLFGFYGLFLKVSKNNFISKKQLWSVIFITAIILTFSYNAFSYDLFNYIFDAKIITHYGQNPYIHKALDFPGDPMLSFMRWTHRMYPYGPVWLAVTVPLSFLGFQFFLPTFFLFKILMAICFLGSVYFISKILQKTNPKEELFGMILFALNPLILIESLVSSHNDIVMIFLSLISVHHLINKKYVRSFLLLLLSIGIKFATVFLLPIYIFVIISYVKNKQIHWMKVFLISSILMSFAILAAIVRPDIAAPWQIISSFQTNVQPWYLLFAIPFAVLVGKKYYTVLPLIILSFFSLLIYAPYIYFGDYNPPVPTMFFWLIICGIISCALSLVLYPTIKMLGKRSR